MECARSGPPRLSHPNAHPRHRQLHGRTSEPGSRRHRAPERQANGQDRPSGIPICEIRHRDAETRVDQCKRRPQQESHHRVGEVKFLLDWHDENREDVAIQVIERVHDGQYRQHVVSITPSRDPLGL